MNQVAADLINMALLGCVMVGIAFCGRGAVRFLHGKGSRRLR